MAARREAVRSAAVERQQQVRTSSDNAAQSVLSAATTERQTMLASIDAALERVRVALDNARNGINTQRRTKLAEVNDGARTKREALDAALNRRRTELLGAADTQARAARGFGESEANRAVRECATTAGRARGIGEQKAQQYQSAKRGPRIAADAREMATDTATKVEAAGAEVAAAVRKDANDLAEKFLREAREGADKFEEARTAGRKKIEDERKTAVDGIDKCADDAITGLERAAAQASSGLQSQRAQMAPTLLQAGQSAAQGLRGQGDTAAGQIDTQTAMANSSIDTFQSRVTAALTGAPASAAQQVVEQADGELAGTLGEYDRAQQSQVSEMTTTLDTTATTITGQLATATGQVCEPVDKSAADFETQAGDTLTKTNDSITDSAKKAVDGMGDAVTVADREAGKAVTDADTGWGQQVEAGRRQAAGKVDDTLAKQNQTVNELGAHIDDRAREISDESWLSRAAHFLAGVFIGFLQELWDFVKILAWIILIVLAVVLVIALIILAIGGIAALLEAIAAVAAFLAAAAAVIKVILIVLAVIGIVVLVALAAWRIYQAWSRDDLSDYERGKLVGRAAFDILSILIPGRVLKFLGEAKWLTTLVESLGGQTRFVMLLIWARGDIVAVRAIVAEIRSIEEIMIIVRRTASITEFIELKALIGDTPRLIRLLRAAPSVAELKAIVTLVGSDSALLDELLTAGASWSDIAGLVRAVAAAGGDAAMLRIIVTRAGSVAEASRLLGIVTGSGGNAPMLVRLLQGTASPAELGGLLTRLRNDAPLLDELITATDDIPQLKRMLTALGDDGAKLRNLLTSAGGKPSAAMLADLMDLAVARGKSAGDVADLIAQAGNNATEFQRLGNLTKLFGARTPRPGAAGPPMGRYTGSNMPHFLDEHTIAHYDFTKTGANGQSFWPAGHTAADVQAELQTAVNLIENPGSAVTSRTMGATPVTRPTPCLVLNGGQPNSVVTPGTIKGPVRLMLPSGIEVQFGTLQPNTAPSIGQFFPANGPGVQTLTKAVLDAIAKIVG